MPPIGGRLKHAWNAFTKADVNDRRIYNLGESSESHTSVNPHRRIGRYNNERSIVTSIYARLAVDVSSIEMRHVRVDDDGRFQEEIRSALNNCFNVEANVDQAATAFRQDIAMTLFYEGVAAVVPIETSLDPSKTSGYDVHDLRVGEVLDFYPRHVKVRVLDDKKGKRRDLILEKKYVAIIVNPLYSVMNEPNSTLKRLANKLQLLDIVDESSSSGKLDLIIQLPYVIKSESRRAQAEKRRKDIEFQLKDSKYGIAYTDGTEKIVQLNRPVENNLLNQVKYLTEMLYNQLGVTEEIMNGTANEQSMLNYHTRTIAPILTAITEEFNRTFLTKTARTQGQAIRAYRDPFKYVPLEQIVEMADKFTRNEIASSNEIRQVIGWKPSTDPKADELRNSNMPAPSEPAESSSTETEQEGDSQNGRR